MLSKILTQIIMQMIKLTTLLSVLYLTLSPRLTSAYHTDLDTVERACDKILESGKDCEFSRTCRQFLSTERQRLKSEEQRCNSNNKAKSCPNNQPKPDDFQESYEADYVIVGAGSGSLTAARLAKKLKNKTVILISKGGDIAGGPQTGPFLYETGNIIPKYNLNAKTKITRDTGNYAYPEVPHNGGQSAINGGVVVKPPKEFWDQIASAGFASWGFNKIRSIVNSIETYVGPDSADTYLHGDSGEIIINNIEPEPQTKILDQCAAEILGTSVLSNQDGFTVGVGPVARAIDTNGVRQNVYVKTILPLLSDSSVKNLKVIQYSHCSEIEWSGKAANYKDGQYDPTKKSTLKAEGIHCYNENVAQGFYVKAKKKLILAADAFGNVRILQKSGVGPCNHLESLGISCVMNNTNVGKWLMSDYNVPALAYVVLAGGPSSHNAGHISLATFQSSLQKATGSKVHDVQSGYSFLLPGTYLAIPYQNIYKSYGEVKIKTPNESDDEYVVNNLFLDSRDALPMVENLNITRRIFGCAAQKGLVTFEVLPSGLTATMTPSQVATWVASTGVPQYHNHGTTAMGLVVDENQNVLGVQNLGIVGASVMPPGAGWIPTHSCFYTSLISAAKMSTDLGA